MVAGLSETKFVEEPCPTNMTTTPNFKLKDFEGIWYTQYQTSFDDPDPYCRATLLFDNEENEHFMKSFSVRHM